jgi:hypothetical protein
MDTLWSVSIAVLAALLPIAFCLGRNYLLLGDLAGTSAKVEYLGWSSRPFDTFLDHPIFSASGFWTFWNGLMKSFWRGELVWHSKPIADSVVDEFYSISSLVLLLLTAVASWKGRRLTAAQADAQGIDAAVQMAVWSSLILSVLCLAFLSVWFEYGAASYPSQKEPYFWSGRLIAGALVPFLVLYVNGATFLFKRFSRVAGPLLFVALTSLMMAVSELALTKQIFANPYNWFHLP